jgi:PadR family transcriptional regulator PadR
MTRNRALSRHALALLAGLVEAGEHWSYGYELASRTGIKSGTLYPLLIRLESQGLLEADWQSPAASGRPPRHAYRLTAAGRSLARTAAAAGASVAIADWRGREAAS